MADQAASQPVFKRPVRRAVPSSGAALPDQTDPTQSAAPIFSRPVRRAVPVPGMARAGTKPPVPAPDEQAEQFAAGLARGTTPPVAQPAVVSDAGPAENLPNMPNADPGGDVTAAMSETNPALVGKGLVRGVGVGGMGIGGVMEAAQAIGSMVTPDVIERLGDKVLGEDINRMNPGQAVTKWGESYQEGKWAPPDEIAVNVTQNPAILKDPRWWLSRGPEVVGTMLPFMMGGYVGGAVAGVKGAVAASAGFESLFEAGLAYHNAIEKGQTPEQAAIAAAQVMAWNLVLTPIQSELVFGRAAAAIASKAGWAAPVVERGLQGVGEGLQEIAQDEAQIAASKGFDPQAAEQRDPLASFALGALGGIGAGTTTAAVPPVQPPPAGQPAILPISPEEFSKGTAPGGGVPVQAQAESENVPRATSQPSLEVLPTETLAGQTAPPGDLPELAGMEKEARDRALAAIAGQDIEFEASPDGAVKITDPAKIEQARQIVSQSVQPAPSQPAPEAAAPTVEPAEEDPGDKKARQFAQTVMDYTGGRGNIWDLAGDKNKKTRAILIEMLRGEKVPLSKAGINRLMQVVNTFAGISGGTIAEQQDRLAQWLKDTAALKPPDRPTPAPTPEPPNIPPGVEPSAQGPELQSSPEPPEHFGYAPGTPEAEAWKQGYAEAAAGGIITPERESEQAYRQGYGAGWTEKLGKDREAAKRAAASPAQEPAAPGEGPKEGATSVPSPATPAVATDQRPWQEAHPEPDRKLEPAATGNVAKVKTETMGARTRWALVKLDDLLTSFGQGYWTAALQPRLTDRAASRDKIQRDAEKLDPDQLLGSVLAGDGAPIVLPSRDALTRNHGIESMRLAREKYPERWAAYQERLKEHAEEVGLPAPAEDGSMVAVRILDEPAMTASQLNQFARDANEPTRQQMSASEQALADANAMLADGRILGLFKPSESGEIQTMANMDFIRAFVDRIASPNTRNRVWTPGGVVSKEGKLRIVNAIFAIAYPDPELLAVISEEEDADIKNIIGGMLKSIGSMARLKDLIDTGNAYPQFDIGKSVLAAVQKVGSLKREGVNVASYMKNQNMFETDPVVDGLILALGDPQSLGGERARAVTGDRVAAFFRAYARAAEGPGGPKQQTAADLPTTEDTILWAIKAVKGKYEGFEPSLPLTQGAVPGEDKPAGGEPGGQAGAGSGQEAAPAGAGPDQEGKAGSDEDTKGPPDAREPVRGYDPRQLELIYDDAETRPGTTQADKARGIAALKALFARDRGAGASILGSGLWQDFVEQKGSQLIGKTAPTHRDLALLAQILRDNRFETLRFIFMKGDTILDTTAFTSRLPETVNFVGSRKAVASGNKQAKDISVAVRIFEIRQLMRSLGADGYFLMHNHPGGVAKPSDGDAGFTDSIRQDMPGFRGHVVIDHDHYGFIGPSGLRNVFKIPASEEKAPELPHDAVGQQILNVGDLKRVSRSLTVEKGMTVLAVQTAQRKVIVLAEVPTTLLTQNKARAMARLRRLTRYSGGMFVSAIGDFSSSDNKALMELHEAGVLFDAVPSGGGATLLQQRVSSGKDVVPLRERVASSRRVEEGRSDYDTGPELTELGFFSPTLEAVKAWQPKGTVEQLRAHLKKIPGATEEAKWIGLDDFLKDKKTVTRDEVDEFVRSNRVSVEEVVRGGPRLTGPTAKPIDPSAIEWISDSDFEMRAALPGGDWVRITMFRTEGRLPDSEVDRYSVGVMDADGEDRGEEQTFDSLGAAKMAAAEALGGTMRTPKSVTEPIHSIDITPKMKEAGLRGLSLFEDQVRYGVAQQKQADEIRNLGEWHFDDMTKKADTVDRAEWAKRIKDDLEGGQPPDGTIDTYLDAVWETLHDDEPATQVSEPTEQGRTAGSDLDRIFREAASTIHGGIPGKVVLDVLKVAAEKAKAAGHAVRVSKPGEDLRALFGTELERWRARLHDTEKADKAYYDKKQMEVRVQLSDTELSILVGKRLTNEDTWEYLSKIKFMSPKAVARLSRILRRRLPEKMAKRFGVTAKEQATLSDAVEAIRTIDINGEPVFGTKELIRDDKGEITGWRWRFTKEQGEAAWAKLSPQGKKAALWWASEREVIKSMWGIKSEVEGYLHHFWDKGFIDGFRQIKLSRKKASALKMRYGKEGYVRDFERSVLKGYGEMRKAKIWNDFIKQFANDITLPIPESGEIEAGWKEIPKTAATRSGRYVGQIAGGRQIPASMYNEFVAYVEGGNEISSLSELMRLAGRYLKANLLMHPGTAATNVIGGAMQYSTHVIDEFWHSAATGDPKRFAQVLWAPLDTLRPSVIEALPDELYGVKSGLMSEMGEKREWRPADYLQGGKKTEDLPGGVKSLTLHTIEHAGRAVSAFSNAGLWYWAHIENYFKRVITVAELRRMGKPIDIKQLIEDEQSFRAVSKLVDTYAFDYTNVPLALKKFRENPIGAMIAPFPTFSYKLTRMYTHVANRTLQAFDFTNDLTRPERLARIMTLATITLLLKAAAGQLKLGDDDKDEDKGGGRFVEGMNPRLDSTGAIRIWKDAEKGDAYLWVRKYPWFSFWMALEAGRKLATGDTKGGLKELRGLRQEFLSEGPLVKGFDIARGLEGEYDRSKPDPVRVAEIVKSFIPVSRLTEGLKDAYGDPQKVYPKTFGETLKQAVPFAQRTGKLAVDKRTKQLIIRDPTLEQLKFWAGINIKRIRSEDYQGERGRMIGNALKALGRAQTPEDFTKSMERLRQLQPAVFGTAAEKVTTDQIVLPQEMVLPLMLD